MLQVILSVRELQLLLLSCIRMTVSMHHSSSWVRKCRSVQLGVDLFCCAASRLTPPPAIKRFLGEDRKRACITVSHQHGWLSTISCISSCAHDPVAAEVRLMKLGAWIQHLPIIEGGLGKELVTLGSYIMGQICRIHFNAFIFKGVTVLHWHNFFTRRVFFIFRGRVRVVSESLLIVLGDLVRY